MRLRGLLVCLLASPALAQDQLIPKELVDGLLASRGARQPVMYVGEVPREMANKIYVPKGARVLGGMSYGSGGTVIMLSNQSRESLAAELERELPKMGWTQFDPSLRMMNPYSEFRDAPIPAGTVRIQTSGPQQFCGPSGGMTVTLEQAGFADTRITVNATDVNMCANVSGASIPPEVRREYAGRPTFVNPLNARNDMSGCYRNQPGDNFNSSSGGGGMISTNMSAQALLDHYSKQMADSGWKPVDVARVTRSWTRTDSAGKPLRYTLSINGLQNSTCLQIETRFERNRPY